MRAKKAKGLRRLAKAFVIQNNKPLSEIDFWYKRMKATYKSNKGEI
jgi:hypothetical protein